MAITSFHLQGVATHAADDLSIRIFSWKSEEHRAVVIFLKERGHETVTKRSSECRSRTNYGRDLDRVLLS
jgi:hypothetical protein